MPRNPLVELVGYLRPDIIPLKLAASIFKKNDINVADEDGNTALFFAVQKSQLPAIRKLLTAGAKNTRNSLSRTPFLHAIRFATSKIVNFFLNPDNFPDSFNQNLLETDLLNRNAWHIAAAAPDLIVTRILVKDRRFAHCINDKDLYGDSPFDLALIGQQSDIAVALSNRPKSEILQDPHYGNHHSLDINQDKVNDKLFKYLELTGRQGNFVLEEDGNCNGWVFLFFLYARESANKFNDILTTIASWDGTLTGLLTNPLPPTLKRNFSFASVQELFDFYVNKQGPFEALWRKRESHPELTTFFSKFKNAKDLRNFLIKQHRNRAVLFETPCQEVFERYHSIVELFEEITYHLCFFQFSTPAVMNLHLGWEQESRLQQYQFLQSSHSNCTLNLIYNFKEMILNERQLAEFLEYFAKRPNSFVDIGGAEHAVGLYVTDQSKLHYFDPNFARKVIPFACAVALAEHIFKYLFRSRGQVTNGKIIISFDGYQLIEQNQPMQPLVITDFPSDANHFPPLHKAIMQEDLKLADAIIQGDPLALYAKDSHNHTAFRMAIRMQNGKCLALIINAAKKAKLDLKQIVGKMNFAEFRNLKHSSYIMYLFNNNVLTPDSIDEENRTLLHCAIGYQSKLIAKKVMNHPSWNVNAQDSLGKTPLMSAIIYNKELMYLMLDDPAVNVNLLDNAGMSVLMQALSEGSLYTNDLIIKLKNKSSLKFDPNLIDEDGRTAVFYIILDQTDPSTLEYLRNSGVRINSVDNKGITALIYALQRNINLPLMRALLRFPGLDINRPNKSRLTPLMQGILFKTQTAILSLLLKDDRIQVNDRDREGLTALMHALKNKADKQLILQLINHPELNILIKDKAGKSALEYAREYYLDKEIIHAILAKKGAQQSKPSRNVGAVKYLCSSRYPVTRRSMPQTLPLQAVKPRARRKQKN